MDYVLVCAVSLIAAALTLFSGFGLGTILTPVFALFFPVPVAISATAVVHLANNLFKLALVGRLAHGPTVLRFGVPAALAALAGAALLNVLSATAPLVTYEFGHRPHQITLVKLVIGVLILLFIAAEFSPRISAVTFPPRYLPWGGALSGFFGGLSGNQGALRSAFLVKCGLSKEAFIGTGVVSAVLVDAMRLPVYFGQMRPALEGAELRGLILAATLAAFAGSYGGARWVRKVTLRTVQTIVAIGLAIIAAAMATGII